MAEASIESQEGGRFPIVEGADAAAAEAQAGCPKIDPLPQAACGQHGIAIAPRSPDCIENLEIGSDEKMQTRPLQPFLVKTEMSHGRRKGPRLRHPYPLP